MPDPVVFWDIDGTLLSGSLEGGFVRHLRNNGQLSLWRMFGRFARLMIRVPIPRGHQFKLAYLRNEPADEVERWMDSYWQQEVNDKLYPDIRRVVDEFRSRRFQQVLLSGTLRPLARRLGENLGIDEVMAAEPEVVRGLYTGGLTRPHPSGPRKTAFALEWLKKNNLDFYDAVALGNHFSDRDLLGRVLVPIAVNPTDRLRAYATKMGWPMVAQPAEVTGLIEAIVERIKR